MGGSRLEVGALSFSISADLIEKIYMICWSIWCARNELVWNSKSSDCDRFEGNNIKVNCDAALFGSEPRFGLGSGWVEGSIDLDRRERCSWADLRTDLSSFSNCEGVIHTTNFVSISSPYGLVIDDCRRILQNLTIVSILLLNDPRTKRLAHYSGSYLGRIFSGGLSLLVYKLF
uniref:Uncharacterized protein n=1 Tax=Cannabis sativa TaxID=3483 RepID=A0A803PHQ7_CANSA